MSTVDISTCHEGVTRKGVYEPCEKPAVAMRNDPETGDPYPVCSYHARGDMVPLTEVLEQQRAIVLDEVPQITVIERAVPAAWVCPECRDGKHRNCTSWTMDDHDNIRDCECDHA